MPLRIMSKSPTKIAICPQPDTIAKLVSGRLDEIDAERLFLHIETCSSCQQIVDQQERRADGLLTKAQQAYQTADPPFDHQQLSTLIRKAQDLGERETSVVEAERQTIPVGNFVTSLKRCGLFQDSELDGLLSDLSAEDSHNSSSIAKTLVRKKRLTPFQARVLLKGRWKGLVLGNYELLDKLGQGGMGSVFRARHRRLRRIVCVKVMNSAGRKSPQMIERFRNEARTVAALSHPNFVVAHDADEAEGVPFLVMEYVEGSDLAKCVSANGPLPLDKTLRLMHQAAIALQYAHDQGVTHRDIKPHNLLLSQDSDTGADSVKILDMGLARFDALLSDNPDASVHAAMTNTGVIMGTVDYMSPEQAIRSRDADNRSDIYSLGCTLHFLLTGQPVYQGDTIMARLIAHREQPVPSLQAVCPNSMPQLDAVFHRMIAKKPADRYQSMQELAEDVSAIMAGRTPAAQPLPRQAQPVSILEKRRELRRKPGYGIWLLVAAACCLFGVAGVLTGQAFQPTPGADDGSLGDPNLLADTATTSIGAGGNKAAPRAPAMNLPFGFGSGQGGLDSDDQNATSAYTALLVVPSDHYNARECRQWEEAIQAEGMQVSYASTNMKSPRPKDDKEHHIPTAKMVPLTPFPTRGFDAIFLVGGTVKDFDTDSKALDSALVQALAYGSVIGRLESSGYKAIGSIVEECDNRQRKGTVKYSTPLYQLGTVLDVRNEDQIADLVKVAKEWRSDLRAKLRTGVTSVLSMLDRNKERNHDGAAGRALVVVPMQKYHVREYRALQNALTEYGMDSVLMSSQSGFPRGDNGQLLNEYAQLRLDLFDAKYFDTIFLVGGSLEEFVDPSVSDQFRQMIDRALKRGLCVATTSPGAFSFLAEQGIAPYPDREHHGKVKYGMPDNFPGAVALAVDPQYIGQLIEKTNGLRDNAIRIENLERGK